MKLLALAKNAYKESVRQPIFYQLLLISAFLIFLSQFMVFFAFGEEAKMIRDMGLATVTICGLFLALFSSSTVIARELEKQTATTVLTKPIGRNQFILGKFLGIIGSLLLALFVLTLVFLLALYRPPSVFAWKMVEARLDLSILPGIFLIYLQIVIMTAISVALSVRLGMVPNIIISSFIFILGNLANYLIGLFVGQGGWVQAAGRLIYLIPNLDSFNVAGAIAFGVPVPLSYLLSATFYAVAYVAIALLGAMALFRNREIR